MLFVELPCSPCKNPENCAVEGFCRTLIQPQSILGALDLALALSRADTLQDGKNHVQTWSELNTREYASRRNRVLFTGWKELPKPIPLLDLTSVIGKINEPTLKSFSRFP
jgi:hypothetical protein